MLQNREPSLLILILLACFASVSAVLFTPALPEIASTLGVSPAEAQLTITVFLIGYALGVLPYGPLSNRYGRKPAIFMGISLAIFGNFLIILVVHFPFLWLLVLGRLLVALGSSVGLKIAFTIVGDAYQHEKATKKISYLMLSFAIVPALAIGTGGFLTEHFGWESCFYFLTVYSIVLLLLSFFLPETCPERDKHALKIKSITEGYVSNFKNRKLVLCSLLMGCGTAVIYLFAAEAPFIGINQIGLSAAQYGLSNFIPPIGIIIGSILANFLAGKKDPLWILLVGISIASALSVVMLLFFFFGTINIWTLFIPMPLIYIGESLVFANASSLVMSHAKNKSYASSIMNFINMGMSVCVLLIFESIPTKMSYMMPLIFVVSTLVMLLVRARLCLLLRPLS